MTLIANYPSKKAGKESIGNMADRYRNDLIIYSSYSTIITLINSNPI